MWDYARPHLFMSHGPMCAAHNCLLSEMALGREYVERRIDFRQRKPNG